MDKMAAGIAQVCYSVRKNIVFCPISSVPTCSYFAFNSNSRKVIFYRRRNWINAH